MLFLFLSGCLISGDEYAHLLDRAEDADGDGHVAEKWGGGDCDDRDSNVYPGAVERCDGSDTNCDGLVDNEAADAPRLYLDTDGDGFGDPTTQVISCSVLSGYVTSGGDCDDSDLSVSPNAVEQCGEVDWDCDGIQGDQDPDVPTNDRPQHYPDKDSDGFGDQSQPGVASCLPVDGLVEAGESDCDDSSAAVYPGATEVCADGIDNDCSDDALECRLYGEQELPLRSGFSEVRALGAASGGIPGTVFAADAQTQDLMAFDVRGLAFPAGPEERFWSVESGAKSQDALRVATASTTKLSGLLVANTEGGEIQFFLSSEESLSDAPTATLRGEAVTQFGDGLLGFFDDDGEMRIVASGVREDESSVVFIWMEEPEGSVSSSSASIILEAERSAQLGSGTGLISADLQGSGSPRLLVARADPMVVYLLDVNALAAGSVASMESAAEAVVDWPEAGDRTVLSEMDANSDGYDDLLIANYQTGFGEVLVFLGGAGFGDQQLADSDAALRLEPELGRSKFGTGLSVADLDGDRVDDLIVLSDGGLGRASVYYGPLSVDGPSSAPDAELIGPGPDACFQNLVVQDAFDGGIGLFVACEDETLLLDAIGM